MIVLSRKKHESIVIDDDITIVVVEIRGDKVRLGIEAPKEVPVHRREVFDAIHKDEPSGLERNLRQEFHKGLGQQLSSGNYKEAYELAVHNSRYITHDELFKIAEGLYKEK